MRKLGLCFITCIYLAISLTSCNDAREIDSWAYVYTIGVDKGVADKIRLTVQIPKLAGEQGGGGAGSGAIKENDFTVISIDCPTLYAGVNMINTSLAKVVNFMHAKYMVISEDMAREGVQVFMNGMVRNRQIRRIMHIIVVKGSAREFVKEINPVLGTAIAKAQEGFMDREDDTALFDDTTYYEFLGDMKSFYKQPTAVLAAVNDFTRFQEEGIPVQEFRSGGEYFAGEVPRSGGNKIEFVGTALFDGDKMVGELNGDETRAMLMVRGDYERSQFTIPDPFDHKLRVTADVRKQKSPDIKVTFGEGKPKIQVKVFLEGDL